MTTTTSNTESREPAYRVYTAAVGRGIAYAIAALEFDATHHMQCAVEGLDRKAEGMADDDLLAAVEWLRYQREKREHKA